MLGAILRSIFWSIVYTVILNGILRMFTRGRAGQGRYY